MEGKRKAADEVKWIKIVTDIFDDSKIKLIRKMPEGDAIIVIWLQLLCLCGKSNNAGLLTMGKIAYTDEMLATIFDRGISIIRLALSVFANFGMIEIYDMEGQEVIAVSNWEKHQNIEGMDKIREQNRIRKQNERARKKAALEAEKAMLPEPGEESRDMSRDVTGENKSKNKNKNKNKNNTNNTVSKADLENEFEDLWKLYPRKKDKERAKKAYISARKKGTTYEQVEDGIRAYKAEIARTRKDPQYIKHGSSWFSGHCWEDEYDGGNGNEEHKGHSESDYYTDDFRQA